jgi:hypothetical protein
VDSHMPDCRHSRKVRYSCDCVGESL